MENFVNPNFFIIDVRTESEYSAEHLYNSININYYDPAFSELISEFDTSATFLVHCQSGGRSAKALQVFKSLGFEMVFEMKGGFRSWTGRTTTEKESLIYRYVNTDSAFIISKTKGATLVNVTHSDAFETFNVKESKYYSHDSISITDSLKQLDKRTPIMLYSSCEENLDSIFKYLFIEGFHEVYYYKHPYSEWIEKGYEYNTKKESAPKETSSIANEFQSNFTITANSASIIVKGKLEGKARLIELTGEVIEESIVDNSVATFSFPEHKGVFIIQNQNVSIKIALQ